MIIMLKTLKNFFIVLKTYLLMKDFIDNECNGRLVWRPLITVTMVTDFYGQHCDCKAISHK